MYSNTYFISFYINEYGKIWGHKAFANTEWFIRLSFFPVLSFK